METTVDSVRMEVLQLELNNLLEEYARSMNLRLHLTFTPQSFGTTSAAFRAEITAFKIDENAVGELQKSENIYVQYEKRWHRDAINRGLDPALLGKVIEVTSSKQKRVVHYRIMGLEIKRTKYCVTLVDVDTGASFRGTPQFVMGGKVIE